MAKKQDTIVSSSSIAIMALVVSMISAGFSIYQWWSSDRESRIVASIEFSKSHFKEINEDTALAIMKAYDGETISDDEMSRIAKYADHLDYIALLLNNGRLNQIYLDENIQCGMLFSLGALANIQKVKPEFKAVSLSEIEKFAPYARCDIKAVIDKSNAKK